MAERFPPSLVVPGHRDFAKLDQLRLAILRRVGNEADFGPAMLRLIRDATEFVIDPVRTARTRVEDLDNVEKTFVGLKVEHYLRDLLDLPKGERDLVIDGENVDVKNTVGNTWMIPPETYRVEEVCLVIATAKGQEKCWLGLFRARSEYLGAENRDGKRAVTVAGRQHILWLLNGVEFPANRWDGLDMKAFRELRQVEGGTARAVAFFRANLRRPIHRSIVQSLLFDQKDYMKRLRGNGGARDVLRREKIALLSGTYDAPLLDALGLAGVGRDEWIAVNPTSEAQHTLLVKEGMVDK